MDNKEIRKYWFFGSKLNTALLAILIILMIIALRWMHENREVYFPQQTNIITSNTQDIKSYQIEGNKDDLISFSITPGQEVFGKVHAAGSIKGGYFFEGNMPVYVFDEEKKIAYPPNQGYATATTDWMTSNPVLFTADFDFTTIPKGKAYIGLMQADPSGGANDVSPKSVFIPIVIK